ncbi:hypothetical protein [Nonomuraea endophytica]|uniref:Uncharacterized protein n=1 Tax=Nonomuraea endophytica TaxID=714136 RepID=A0A7W7ZX04_9ACTN|nr:hypothetical protein [Nonomuraea endophytica]MBB5075328.1 hypothetical protein [Nonomuraea endophytica]
MAIPKKGSRLITVDDVVYRWRIRHKPTYGQGIGESPLRLAVQLADAPGRVLLVSLRCHRPDTWLGEEAAMVRPALVAMAITKALHSGWLPSQRGSQVRLDLSRDDLAGLAEIRPALSFTRFRA